MVRQVPSEANVMPPATETSCGGEATRSTDVSRRDALLGDVPQRPAHEDHVRPYALSELDGPVECQPALTKTGECLVRIEFGSRHMTVAEIQRLQSPSLLTLFEPYEADARVTIEGTTVATGKVVIVDGKVAVQITQLLCQDDAGGMENQP